MERLNKGSAAIREWSWSCGWEYIYVQDIMDGGVGKMEYEEEDEKGQELF